ncbi:hypothetical protein JCM33374_g3058 [Metschnikowia sp. JCM 33374]|nr:hypothetical protein JCM33374_g3058 [Metschnikowia sp. JCM 33374]
MDSMWISTATLTGIKTFNEDPNYYSSGCKQFGYLGNTNGEIYNYPITISNFFVGCRWILLGSSNQVYKFNMYADDGAFLQVGAGETCCGNALDDVKGANFRSQKFYEANTVFSLQKVFLLPSENCSCQSGWSWWFQPWIYFRDGRPVDDIGKDVHQIHQVCTTTSTATWTGSDISTVTQTGSDSITVVVEVPSQNNTLVVNLPAARTTSYWNNPYASTSVVYPNDGGQPTVIIEQPLPATTTTYWSNTYSSTTTLTPTDGGQATVIVEQPQTNLLQGCTTGNVIADGFNVDFYRYPHWDKTFNEDPNYYSSGYKQFGYLGSISGVNRLYFRTDAPTNAVTNGEIYNYPITISNFSLAVGGYFWLRKSVIISSTCMSTMAFFWQVGAGETCCGNALDDVKGANFKAAWPPKPISSLVSKGCLPLQ